MAVLDRRAVGYIRAMLTRAKSSGEAVWRCDPLFTLRLSDAHASQLGLPPPGFFRGRAAAGIAAAPSLADAFRAGFPDGLLKPGMDAKAERQTVALKLGFPHMPATTAAVILKGFGLKHDDRDVSDVYASHGLSRDTRPLARNHDFIDINRRVDDCPRSSTWTIPRRRNN